MVSYGISTDIDVGKNIYNMSIQKTRMCKYKVLCKCVYIACMIMS